MGKNRQIKKNSYPPTFTVEPEGLGAKMKKPLILPTDGYSPEWMNQLISKIYAWVSYGIMDPNTFFNKEQLSYLKKHMELFNTGGWGFKRLEHPKHFNKLNLKEGDEINLNQIRSFTRGELGGMIDGVMIGDYSAGAVVYVLKGKTPAYSLDFFNDYGEKEVLINMNKMKISKITEINDKDPEIRGEQYAEFTGDSDVVDEKLPKTIKVVEIEYTGPQNIYKEHHEEKDNTGYFEGIF